MKIANYALSFWDSLCELTSEEEPHFLLKTQNRLSERTIDASIVLRNDLISLLDQTFPGVKKMFSANSRSMSGHYKWMDIARRFWNRECVAGLSFQSFFETYRKWCKRKGYVYYLSTSERIYNVSKQAVAVFPKNDSTKAIIVQSVNALNAVYKSLQTIWEEMDRLASLLPEYDIGMEMHSMKRFVKCFFELLTQIIVKVRKCKAQRVCVLHFQLAGSGGCFFLRKLYH